MFACIMTPAHGDCFYQAVSVALFGDVKVMKFVHLCTTLMLIRYQNVFLSALEDTGLLTDFSMTDHTHFITVGAATPSTLIKRSLHLNKD